MPIELSRAKELFLAVLELPAGERAVYLESACGDDTALRQRVDAMLRTHENSGELLPRSPAEMLGDSGSTEADATAAFAQHMEASATHVDSPRGEHDELSFLTPSSQPGNLGRLGHYEIQEVIGKGGFGIVLKAFDVRLHRVVAIKVLSPAYAANGSARRRFTREARTAAAVKNEHVVGIHDVQEDAQPPFLVMEMIDGISLQDKIDRHGPLGIKEILRIGMQMAEGLAAAHKQGLVHRDIKPANILLENGVERVKITDFGLARAVDDASVTQSGTVAGTPMYMSPEQAEGLPIDHRSDLFSLGTVLYGMCTGHPPFRASGTHAVLKRVIDASPRPVREINNEILEWLEAIIAKLHAKKPADRFATAQEVAELLGQHLAHLQQPSMAPMPAAVFRAREAEVAKPLEGAPSMWLPTLIGVVLGAVFASVVGFINPAELSVFGNDSPPWLGFLALAAMGAAIGTLAGFIRVLLFARIALAIRDAGKSAPTPPANAWTTPGKSTLEKLLEGSDTSQRLLQHGLLSVVLAFGTTGVLLIALNPALLWQGIGLVLAAVILGAGVARIKQRWTVAYRGHLIRFENSCMTGESLFIDNIRVARGGVGLRNEVRGIIQRGEGIGEEIVVLAESGLFSFHCRILVDRAPARATTARLALASRIQRWLLAGSAAAVLVLLAAGVGTVLYLRTYPDFAVTLTMDDPDTVVRIWPTAQTEPPENLAGAVQILGTPKYVIQGRTMEDLLLPTGNYWLTAELGGREAHRVFLKVQADSFVTYHRSIVTYHREEEQRPGGKVVNWVSNITFGIPKAISIPAAANLRHQDVARLQGTWHAIAAERHGKALPKPLVDQMNFGLILINGMFIVHMQETAETERIDPKPRLFKISPNKKPAALDLIVPIDTAGGAKNSAKTLLCIYRWEGDTLHLCTSTGERPDDFTTKPGFERMLFVLKRFPGTDKKAEPSWVQLFNGKDLTGWEGLPKLWRVEGDSVIGSTRGNPVKHWTALSSRRPYKGFEIRFKAKLNGANSLSGLYIRGNLQDRIEYNLLGYNAHMGDANWASLFEGTVGVIAVAPEETLNRILRRNDYNDMYVKCVGKHVTIRLNGVTTVDGDFPKMQDEGVIGWQIKPGDPMELTIKDVWLRELPPEEPGWVPLFNGKDLTGWNVGKDAGAWKVAADSLVSVSPKAVATTGKRFSQNFHLRAEIKPVGGRARITFRNGRSLDVSADKDEVWLTLRLQERASEFRASFPGAWSKWIPLDVIVDGGRVDVKADGQLVLTKFELMPFENEKEWSGPIVLSTPHVGSELRFRKVEIKETGPFSALPLTTGK